MNDRTRWLPGDSLLALEGANSPLTPHRRISNLVGLLASLGIVFLATSCSYTSHSEVREQGSGVGATGGIKYTHENLGGGKHLLIVTASPGLMESDSSIQQRITLFANRFAARECPEGFEFVNDPTLNHSSAGFARRTRNFVFLSRTSAQRIPLHLIAVGDNAKKVKEVLGTPANVIGSKRFARGVVSVWSYKNRSDEYWLYFVDDVLEQWGRPGDWEKQADSIYELRFR